MTPAPDAFRRAVPGFAKRRHERWITDRFLRVANELNRRYEAEHGLEVKRGPVAGLVYPTELLEDSGDAVAKLAGVYEQEIHPALQEWLDAGVERIIDIGSAEGYYAVGLAKVAPAVSVLAYDIDPDAIRKCTQLAELNGVTDRLQLEGLCTTEGLAALPAARTALLCDCEGGELELMDPVAVPAMREWLIVIELHDFIDPSISATMTARFEATHAIEMVEGRPRDGVDLPELASFTTDERRFALSERRPGPMRWAVLRPLATA